jgi:hypothetical protein
VTLAPQIGVDSFTATASRFNDGSLDKFFKQKFFFKQNLRMRESATLPLPRRSR